MLYPQVGNCRKHACEMQSAGRAVFLNLTCSTIIRSLLLQTTKHLHLLKGNKGKFIGCVITKGMKKITLHLILELFASTSCQKYGFFLLLLFDFLGDNILLGAFDGIHRWLARCRGRVGPDFLLTPEP